MKKLLGVICTAVLSISIPASALAVGAGGGVSGSININTGTDTGVSVDISGNVNGNGSDSGEGSDGMISITVPGVNVGVNTSVESSGSVTTEADLDSYVRTVIETNDNVRDIDASDTEVSVSHYEQARIFGIFPTTVTARTTVRNDGSVTVKFPWYAYAGAKKAEIEMRVREAVTSAIPATSAEAGVRTEFSAQTKAQIIEKAAAAVKTQLEVDASAKVAS